MFDARLRPLIEPPLNAMGRTLARWGIPANALTAIGVLTGLLAGAAVAFGRFEVALLFVILNRLLDGLDGAVARVRGPSDFGGYLDIVADFTFYCAIPVGFGFASPDNLPAALLLVASFTLTGISFLAFAAIAAKRGAETDAHGAKSFFYSTGLAEGAETIVVFCAMCLFPSAFVPIAIAYAALCVLTVLQRTALAFNAFR